MSSSGMNSFTLTPQDVTGRSRLHFNEAASCDDFIDKCRLLDAAAAGTTGTKWIVRGLVKDPMSAAEIGEALAFDSPVEVTSFPTSTEFGTGSFLWVARCAPDRIPSIAHQHQTLERIRKVYEYSRSLNERFHHETDALLNKAANAGLRIVCNDPRNEWGRNAVDADVFTRLITNLFYYDEETAGRMLRGQGYSPLGHYLFSLKNAEGTPLCFFMIAEWPWGFEATYTMIDARYAGPALRMGAARVLMILASALFMSRHGNDSLVYGEANYLNMRPCVQSGYESQPPEILGGPHPVHTNIDWADSPVGSFGDDSGGSATRSPRFGETEYTSYMVGRLNPERVAPFIGRAFEFLDVR
ncbi:hypothetical protein [Streptomyces sp. NBC_00728]|jgi:hypothetical protein|uniref:hypothetical protein n=1 Tax=Streptomyces sp. NBC_00728 TaxID=2903676 RepID=UPI00386A8AD1